MPVQGHMGFDDMCEVKKKAENSGLCSVSASNPMYLLCFNAWDAFQRMSLSHYRFKKFREALRQVVEDRTGTKKTNAAVFKAMRPNDILDAAKIVDESST